MFEPKMQDFWSRGQWENWMKLIRIIAIIVPLELTLPPEINSMSHVEVIISPRHQPRQMAQGGLFLDSILVAPHVQREDDKWAIGKLS